MNVYEQMRETLEYIVSLLRSDTFVVLNPPAVEIIAKILLASEAALALPPRNCDVGTAEEQYKRYSAFTSKWTPCSFNGHARCAGDCPVNKILERDGSGDLQCPFVWAQMPYRKEKRNEGDIAG